MLLGLEKYAGFCETVEQKLNAVQKAAWSIYLQASNDNARFGALRTVLESLEIHDNIIQTKDIYWNVYRSWRRLRMRKPLRREENGCIENVDN